MVNDHRKSFQGLFSSHSLPHFASSVLNRFFTTAYWSSVMLLLVSSNIGFLCPGFKRCFMLLKFWTSGFTWFPSPTPQPRKLNAFLKSQQEQRDSSQVQENLKPSSMQTSCVSDLSLSSWLQAEKDIRKFVRGENGLAAGVFWKLFSAVSLNVPGHTGYINKNSYGRDCIRVII